MKARFLIFLLIGCIGYAAPIDTTKTAAPEKPKTEKKTETASDTTVKPQTAEPAGNAKSFPVIKEATIKTISILFFVVMLVLIILFFIQAYLKNMYLGFQSIKFIGLVIMFPGICILALVGGDLISGETLAALLGTIAGYVLSREDDSKTENVALATLKKEKVELEAAYKDMETKYKNELEELKKKLPKGS